MNSFAKKHSDPTPRVVEVITTHIDKLTPYGEVVRRCVLLEEAESGHQDLVGEESAERQGIFAAAIVAIKHTSAVEESRTCPSFLIGTYAHVFSCWLLIEKESEARMAIVKDEYVVVQTLLRDLKDILIGLRCIVPVPHDALGLSLGFLGAPRYAPNGPTHYLYHALSSGSHEGARSWASAIASTYELWEGPCSPLGSITWYYNGGELDPLLTASLAYDPLRPVRIRVSIITGLAEQLPAEFAGRLLSYDQPTASDLDALAVALPNTTAICIKKHTQSSSDVPKLSSHELLTSLARFRCLTDLKIVIASPSDLLVVPVCPTVRFLCCDVLGANPTTHSIADAITHMFPNLEELHYATDANDKDLLASDLVSFAPLHRLRVLKLRCERYVFDAHLMFARGSRREARATLSAFGVLERAEPPSMLDAYGTLRRAIPGLRIVISPQFLRNSRGTPGGRIDVCPFCPYSAL